MTSGEFRIIEADSSQIDFLASYGAESFIEAYQVTLSRSVLRAYTRKAFSAEGILHELEQSAAAYFVCISADGKQCGYSKFIDTITPPGIASDAAVELQRLYVKQEYRGQEIGKQLAEAGERKARRQGKKMVWLRVWEGNDAAIAVYRKWNFSVCGKEQYSVGSDARTVLVMKKKLTD